MELSQNEMNEKLYFFIGEHKTLDHLFCGFDTRVYICGLNVFFSSFERYLPTYW